MAFVSKIYQFKSRKKSGLPRAVPSYPESMVQKFKRGPQIINDAKQRKKDAAYWRQRALSAEGKNKNKNTNRNADFYASREWQELRYQALKMSRGCCELCGARPGPGKPLHVDHIQPRSRAPELELALWNLQVLCVDCNLGKSNKDSTDWRTK